jgi:catechol 2,3-dioxygenase-like lactoylglutathione lyase family enzyme
VDVIHHVSRRIPPPKLADCLRFYALLGFERVPEPPGIEGRAVWLSRAGTQIHLMPTAGAQPEHGHVGVVVDDYPGTVDAVRSAGHEVEPRREHWGSPRCYVRDPAGHLVELMAFAPGAAA